MGNTADKQKVDDRTFDLWKFEFDKLYSSLLDAGKSVQSHSIKLGIVIVFFLIITYADIVGGKIKIPLLSLELDRWHACFFGPVFIALFMYTFSAARAFHKVRYVAILKHMEFLKNQAEVPASFFCARPVTFVSMILFPSIYNFVDLVNSPKSINVINSIIQILWILLPPLLQVHLSYFIAKHFSWNPIVVALYLLLAIVSVFALFKIAVVKAETLAWDDLSKS